MWTSERIEELIRDGASESITLEFKAQLPGRSDRDRAEFLKDVSAMANASGGVILYGVAEKNGRAIGLSTLQLPDADAEIRRLSQMAESGLEPRISGLAFHCLSLGNNHVLAIDVPGSFDSPHRYLFNGHSKFVRRVGTLISELSYDQLRSAFDRSSSRIQRIRSEWESDLISRKSWKPIIPGPMCMVRLSPLAAADGLQIINPKAASEHWSSLILSGWGGGSSAFNYEGLAVFHGRGEAELASFVQVHRTGQLSAYRTARLTIDDRKIIPSTTVGNFLIEATGKLLSFARTMGLSGSAVLNVGLIDLAGFEFSTRDRYGFSDHQLSEVDTIRMPEAWIESLDDVEMKVDALLRPGFDLLWQAYGWAECPEYNSEGRWAPKN